MIEKVLITGASGFIGSHVVSYFSDQGVEVICLVQETSDTSFLETLPVEIQYGDIRDQEKINSITMDCTCVIHTAALVKDWGIYDDFFQTNVVGTLNILKACKKNNISNIIITGSCSSYGEENNYSIKDENSPFSPHYPYFLGNIFPCKMNYYRDTKAISISKASSYAAENGLNLTIIEPVWVFGEREFHTGFYEYLKTASSRIPFLPGSMENNFHVIYARDLARAYFLAFQKKLPGVERILIGNPSAEKMDRIYRLFCETAKIRKPRSLPKWSIYPLGFVMELFFTLFSFKDPPLLTRGRVNMFYDNIEYCPQKASRFLDFTCKYSLEQGIARTIKWYQNRNLL
jgi:nucleoside-diphosphate-sugar epimerase